MKERRLGNVKERPLAQPNFSWNNIVNKFVGVYERVMEYC